MEVKYDLVVDFARPSKSNTIMISENDANSRVLHFTLLNNKQPMSMTDVTVATVRGINKSGSTVYGEAKILTDENGHYINEIEFTVPEAIAKETGNTTMTITLLSETNQQLTSFEFYVLVRNALYNEDDLISESDLSGFQDLLSRTTAALKKMEEMTAAEALPNPYPLNMNIEGKTTQYTGREDVDITLEKMAYIADDPEIEVMALDDTAANTAAQSATEAMEYAAQAKGSETNAARSEAKAKESETKASEYAETTRQSIGNAEAYSLIAEGYARGTNNGEPVESSTPYYENNAKYYAELAEYHASKYSIEDRLDSASKDKALSANQGRVLNDTKADKTSVDSLKESLIQFKDDGFLPKNLLSCAIESGTWNAQNGQKGSSDVTRARSADLVFLPKGTYTLTKNGVKQIANWLVYDANRTYIASEYKEAQSTITLDADRYVAFYRLATDFDGNMMIEEGTEAHSYTPYAMSNQGLTQIVEGAIDGGYINNVKVSKADIGVGKVWDGNANANRAIWDIEVKGATKYTIELNRSAFSSVIIVEKVSKGATTQIKNFSLTSDTTTFTTDANTRDVCIQYIKASTMTLADVLGSNMVISEGDSAIPSNASLNESLAQLVADSTPQNLSLTTESNVKQTYRLRAKKIGKEIVLNIYGTLNAITSDLTSWKPLFQMPQGIITSNHIDFALALGGAPYMVQAMVSNTGTIQFVPKQALNDGTLFFINLVYVLD